MMKFLGAVGLAGALALGARAEVFHVNTAQEFQTALSTAAGNGEHDTIYLGAGTYKGRFTFLTTQARDLTIKAEDGLATGQVVLDGQNEGRVLTLDAGTNVCGMTVERLVFMNGVAQLVPSSLFAPGQALGGGVYVQTAGNFHFAASQVRNCRCAPAGSVFGAYPRGGGVFIEGAENIVLVGNVFQGNHAFRGSGSQGENIGGHGGGLYVARSYRVVLENNALDRNIADGTLGSGLYLTPVRVVEMRRNKVLGNTSVAACYFDGLGESVLLEDNLLEGNVGPGVYLGPPGNYQGPSAVPMREVQVLRNTFSANTEGGLVVAKWNNALPTNCVVMISENRFLRNGSGRSASGGGVSIDVNQFMSLSLVNNIFQGNTCTNGGGFDGGGCWIRSATNVNFINNTVFGNRASDDGGGIYLEAPIIHAYNNIIWGNTAGDSGADIFVASGGTEKLLFNNNVHDISGLFDYSGNNLDVAPLFMDQSRGDYRLRANSLCINAGTNGAPGLPAMDLDGNPRIGGGTVDMGAYEQDATDRHPADTNLDWVIQAAEFTAYATAWTNNVSWSNAPSRIPIDYVTRAGYLLEKGGSYHNAGGGKPRNWQPGL